jgi:hypothetical protein
MMPPSSTKTKNNNKTTPQTSPGNLQPSSQTMKTTKQRIFKPGGRILRTTTTHDDNSDNTNAHDKTHEEHRTTHSSRSGEDRRFK